MELMHGYLLQNVAEVDDTADLYNKLMNLLLKYAGTASSMKTTMSLTSCWTISAPCHHRLPADGVHSSSGRENIF